MSYPRISSFKTAGELRAYLTKTGIDLRLDDHLQVGEDAPLAQPYRLANGFTIGNRFCVLPMEGWDGTADGRPSELTYRRWRRFGLSGAKLIWGGEAAAVRHDGRANPNQLLVNENTLRDLAALREGLIAAHPGRTDDLLIGLQLTHSGRYSKPNDQKQGEPLTLYRHPILDRRLGNGLDHPVLTDDDIKRLIDDFIAAARLARRAGFAFVDIKHCHGYLGHEFLSAVDRPGLYGGAFENRTRFLREIAAGIRASIPGLEIGVRVSAFDFIPFRKGVGDVGEPEPRSGKYRFAFGGDGTGAGIDLAEPKKFLDLLASLGIGMVCITAGSPYYNPHITRPAAFPPSDGYLPPEEPLTGVARQIKVTADLKRYRPDLMVVGSAYTYLQEWLPNVAQRIVRESDADFVGLGRMVLPYPEICGDILAGRPLQTRRICRTFSDCTTGPRGGLVSGCYPLDDYYGQRPEAARLKEMKKNRGEL